MTTILVKRLVDTLHFIGFLLHFVLCHFDTYAESYGHLKFGGSMGSVIIAGM